MKEKIDYIISQFQGREQTRFDTTNTHDAATLLMSLLELEWRYHHLALLKYRNHKYKEFHRYFGEYWAIKIILDIIFPWYGTSDVLSRKIQELEREINEEDQEWISKLTN